MTDESPQTEKKRRIRFTLKGKTVLFTTESSSGFITGLGELPGTDANRFHLTVVKSKDGFRSHITDQLGHAPRIDLPKRSQKEAIRFLIRRKDMFGKYRKNEVAWVPIGEMAEKINGVLNPKMQGTREVIPLERLRARIAFDLSDRTKFQRIRLGELKAGSTAYRYVSGRLHMLVVSKDGAKLEGTPVRARNFLNGFISFTGLDLNAYLSFLDQRIPNTKSRGQEQG